MAKRVLITGSSGVMGSVLLKYISKDYDLTLVDMVEKLENEKHGNFLKLDIVKDFERLKKVMLDQDVVINFAWDTKEAFNKNVIVPENKTMIENIYKSALETNPHPGVIMASSVHIVDGYLKDYQKNKKLIKPEQSFPISFYGATKAYMENLGKYYSTLGLQVICLRLGGVNYGDDITNELGYSSIWLSHRDYTQLIKRCIEAEKLPSFSIFFGISDNKNKAHDITNAREILGYAPKDDAEKRKIKNKEH